MNHEQIPESTAQSAEELARLLLGAGAAWARYGLSVARASLDASARTLEATAGVLGALSDHIRERAEARPESESAESF